MQRKDIQALGKAINVLSKPRFVVKKGKTVGKPESRWVVYDLKFKEWVVCSTNYKQLRRISDSWNAEEATAVIPQKLELKLVASNPYTWYELTVRKLNKQTAARDIRQNLVGLKLVG